MSTCRHRRFRCGAGALLICSVLAPGQALGQRAPEASADTLFFGGEFVGVAPGTRGLTGDFQWLHQTAETSSMNAGVHTFALGDGGWTYGRVGATRRVTATTALHGQIDIGAGHDVDDRFAYLTAQGTLIQQLVARRLTLEVEDSYEHIDTTVGHLGRVGLTYIPTRRWTLGASLHSSFGTRLGVRAVTLRIERQGPRATLFGGFSTGRWRPALVGLAGQGAAEGTFEVFGGAVIPLDRSSLTLAMDMLDTTRVRKRSLVVSWKVPL